MTKTVMQCPTQDELTAFIRGDVPADRVEAIAQHLDSCEQCRSRWEQDPSENAFDDDLKWAERAGREVQVDVSVPLRQLREALPDYDIIREIGRGGMGIVYAARHLKLNRDVALKVLPALLGAVRDGAMDRFKREAELTARLKHTNIISVFDYGEVDGTYFYTMELVGGRTLREIIEEVSSTGAIDVVLGIADGSTFDEVLLPAAPLTPRPANQQSATFGSSARNDRKYFRQVATWIAEVAEAVEYAHSKGIIHRDIKPANLILARDRRLMIADFGLARSIESHGVTATHAVVGTARYMSPEQADPLFGKVSEATDVYGLGATLYELLTLRPMFEGKRDVDVVQAVLNKDPVPPRRLVKQVPRELETICLKAVEKRPAERYSSAQALADDLRRWLLDMPIEARRARWPARAYKFARRRKLAVSATAALVVLSVVSVFVAHQSSRWRANAVAAAAAAEAREIEAIQSAAQQDLDSGEFEAGLKRVELALHKHPNADALHISRASLLEGMGRRQEAVKELESYLDAHPNDAEAHLKLSTSYYNLRNKTMGDRHASLYLTLGGSSIASEQRYRIQARIETDPAKQIELFTKVLEINPADVGSVLVRSNLYGRVHRFDEMLADAKRAVAMRPNWALSFGYLGSAHYANKQDKEAEVAYGRAIELDPRNPEWWTGRAMARGNLGVYEGALLDATHAIELDPDSARAYSCRGSIKAYLGDPSGGLLDCARAIELEPNNRMHYHSRMLIYKLVGDWKKFGEDATRVIELKPDDLRGYAYRALSLLNRSAYAEAIEDYDQAIPLDPTNVNIIHDRGLCFLRTNKLESAIADFSECIRIDPRYIPAFEDRATAFRKIGRDVEASADITRAIELGVGSASGLKTRARLAIQMGNFDDAIRDSTAYLAEFPNNAVALMRRGMAYELIGEQEKALKDYSAVVDAGGINARYAWLWKHYLLPTDDTPLTAIEATSNGNVDADNRASVWSCTLLDFAAGKTDNNALLVTATNNIEQSEAIYYIARQLILEGDSAGATRALQECIDLGQVDLLEAEFANALLKRGSGNDHPTPE